MFEFIPFSLFDDAELKDILNAKEGQPGYELQNIAETEIKRRFSKQ